MSLVRNYYFMLEMEDIEWKVNIQHPNDPDNTFVMLEKHCLFINIA